MEIIDTARINMYLGMWCPFNLVMVVLLLCWAALLCMPFRLCMKMKEAHRAAGLQTAACSSTPLVVSDFSFVPELRFWCKSIRWFFSLQTIHGLMKSN